MIYRVSPSKESPMKAKKLAAYSSTRAMFKRLKWSEVNCLSDNKRFDCQYVIYLGDSN